MYIYIQLIKLAMAQLQEEGSQNVRLPHGGSNPATVKDCKEQIRILTMDFWMGQSTGAMQIEGLISMSSLCWDPYLLW